MKVRFFGPLGRVTGSCALLHDDQLNVRILIDAGLQQGEAEQESWNRGALPFDAKSLTHIVLTHAHIDHCGLLPRIVKAGFRGEVICTPETAALAKLELEDCARIGRDYTCADVAKVRFAPKDFPFGAHFPIAHDVFLQFFRTAHILGAVAVRVCCKRGPNQRSILFSGDLGSNVDTDERFLFLRHRMEPPPSTFAVVESTYGDRKRDDGSESFQGRIDGLRAELASARERGGQTLIASFSMDRLQMLILDLAYLCARDTDLARTPILVHTPLGEKISRLRRVREQERPVSGWRSTALAEQVGLQALGPGARERSSRESARGKHQGSLRSRCGESGAAVGIESCASMGARAKDARPTSHRDRKQRHARRGRSTQLLARPLGQRVIDASVEWLRDAQLRCGEAESTRRPSA